MSVSDRRNRGARSASKGFGRIPCLHCGLPGSSEATGIPPVAYAHGSPFSWCLCFERNSPGLKTVGYDEGAQFARWAGSLTVSSGDLFAITSSEHAGSGMPCTTYHLALPLR